MTDGQASLMERTRNILGMYAASRENDDELIMAGLIRLLEEAKDPTQRTETFLHETAKLVHKLFDFKEVCVVMRETHDGFFRFKTCMGFRGGAQEARKKLTYTLDDVMDDKHYPSIPIGKRTRFYLGETMPFRDNEKESFNRPSLLGMQRPSQEDMIEGDYIDFFMLNPDKEPIGWIEVSNTRDAKLPDSKTIRWLEIIASAVAAVLFEREWNRDE